MPLPSPVVNKNAPNFLIIAGKLTKEGADYLKILNVYRKADRRYRLGLNSSNNGLNKRNYN